LTGDDIGMIKRRNKGRASLGRNPRGDLFAILAIAIVKDNLSAVSSTPLRLY
jgi:hypothetical protein